MKEKTRKFRPLILKDFENVFFGHANSMYLSARRHYAKAGGDDVVEICLEPCLNGYDVAIYNYKNKDLLMPKICTDFDRSIVKKTPSVGLKNGLSAEMFVGEIVEAIKIANIKLKRYEKEVQGL